MRVNRNFFRTSFALALISLVFSALSLGQEAKREAFSQIHIDNFGMVNETLYRGEQPHGRDYADLAAGGIKTVLDLRRFGSTSEQKLVEAAGMKYYRIRMDTRSWPTKEQIENFLKIVNDPANQPVFIHCKAGRHRTGVMIAVYRITHDGWTADRAYDEMKHYEFEKGLISHNTLKNYVFGYQSQVDHQDVTGPQQSVKATTSNR